MRTGELVDIAASSVDSVGADEVEIDLDTDAGEIGDQDRAVGLQPEPGRGDAARQRALADIELDEAGSLQAGDELPAEAGEEIRQPGTRHEIDACLLRRIRDLDRSAD